MCMYAQKIHRLLGHLTQDLYEREEAVKLALLSALAGESIFLLGPPGVGKSLVARRLKYAFADGKSFEYLMTRYSTPEEVFGPVSIQKLKENDLYERKTEQYLPGANVVFLDEIWKSGSAIQNALLTLLNEKIYKNGEQEIKVNLHALIAASNETPNPSEGTAPLYDRFLIRYPMKNIRSAGLFKKMITQTTDVYKDPVPQQDKLSLAEIAQLQEAAKEVVIPEDVLHVVQFIKQELDAWAAESPEAEHNFAIYDRRWKKIMTLLRMSALVNDRSEVNLMDCFLIRHCLWNRPEHEKKIDDLIKNVLRDHGYSLSLRLHLIQKEIEAFEKEVEKETQIPIIETKEVAKVVDDQYFELENQGLPFSGNLIKITDFRALNLNELSVLNVFDEQYNLVNRLQAQLGTRPFSVSINYSNQSLTVDFKTVKQQITRRVFKAPHALVQKYWDEWSTKLDDFIQEKQAILNSDRPQELDSIEKHLFIESTLAKIVSSNIDEVHEKLENLQLRLEKAKFAYRPENLISL